MITWLFFKAWTCRRQLGSCCGWTRTLPHIRHHRCPPVRSRWPSDRYPGHWWSLSRTSSPQDAGNLEQGSRLCHRRRQRPRSKVYPIGWKTMPNNLITCWSLICKTAANLKSWSIRTATLAPALPDIHMRVWGFARFNFDILEIQLSFPLLKLQTICPQQSNKEIWYEFWCRNIN